jgi:hypothetical protein
LTKSPNSLFICSTSPFSKGGGSGCVFAVEAAVLGLAAAAALVVGAAAADGLAEGGEVLAGTCFGSVDGGAGCCCCFVVSSLVEVESFGWLFAATLFSSSLLLVLMLLSYL